MCFKERRALFSASALMLTGTVLSIMSYHYFTGEFSEDGVARSRTWWEIVVNGQVLALAFMWLGFSEQMRTEDTKKLFLVRIRMILGLLAVSLPAGILICAAIFGWFEHRVPVNVVNNIFVISIGFWFVTIVVNRFVTAKSKRVSGGAKASQYTLKWSSVVRLLPVTGVFVLVAFDYLLGTARWYYFVPVLCYFQAAVPFLEKGLGQYQVSHKKAA